MKSSKGPKGLIVLPGESSEEQIQCDGWTGGDSGVKWYGGMSSLTYSNMSPLSFPLSLALSIPFARYTLSPCGL